MLELPLLILIFNLILYYTYVLNVVVFLIIIILELLN